MSNKKNSKKENILNDLKILLEKLKKINNLPKETVIDLINEIIQKNE